MVKYMKKVKDGKDFDSLLKKAFEEYCRRENASFPTDEELKKKYPICDNKIALYKIMCEEKTDFLNRAITNIDDSLIIGADHTNEEHI